MRNRPREGLLEITFQFREDRRMHMNARSDRTRRRVRHGVVLGLFLALAGIATAVALAAPSASTRTAGAALASQSCEGTTLLDEIKKRGYIRVAAGTGPPNTFPDVRTGAWQGTNSYIMRAVAKRIGVKLKVSFGPVGAIVPAIQSGRADVTSGLFKNTQRAQVADFSTAFQWPSVNVYVKQGDNSVNSLADLKDKQLGAASGTAELVAAEALVRAGYGKGVSIAQTAPGPLDLLADNRVEAIVLSNLIARYALAQNPGRYRFRAAVEVPTSYFGQAGVTASYFLVRKTPCNATLLNSINATIRTLRAKGEMAKIYKRYGMVDKSLYTPPPNWVD
jgi:polar amino acid transport system substrate-binding protein